MLERLKRHFGEKLVLSKEVEVPEQYIWYETEEKTIVGIEKNGITEAERKLLSVFLKPKVYTERKLSLAQVAWKRVLAQETTTIPFLPVRFVYFSLSEPIDSEKEMEEALKGMLASTFVLLWETEKTGVIVEQCDQVEEVSYEAIVDTFATDFFVTLRLFVGGIHHSESSITENVPLERLCLAYVHSLGNKTKIHTFAKILPMLMLEEIDKEKKASYVLAILGNVLQDPDLLHTIETFLSCNQNVTLAAKNLYMHRNSVQYRVDKFIEKTGIDIKTFQGAVLVFLAMQMRE